MSIISYKNMSIASGIGRRISNASGDKKDKDYLILNARRMA